MAAADEMNPGLIALVRSSKVPTPWSNEFERMISGMNYRASDSQEMQEHRITVKRLLYSFNHENLIESSTIVSLHNERMEIARKLIGGIGERVNIEAPFFCAWGCNTFLGDDVYINRDVQIHDNAPVTIGNRVLIGPSVVICTTTHPIAAVTRQIHGGCHALSIVIGDDVWICARATINPGVKIGRGCVVAAGSVVAKDVEAGMLVGGVPAKVLRKLEEGELEKLAREGEPQVS